MNLPNKITTIRLALIPFIVFFYLASFISVGKLIATILFAVAVLTDFLDGYYARKLNLVTTLGKFLDSIADKVLVVSALILIVADGTILAPFGVISAIIIVAREFAVSALRQLGAAKNVIIAADMWGKVKANFQFFAVLLFMLYSYLLTAFMLVNWLNIVIFVVCYALLGATVISTIMSGIHYIIANKTVFTESTNTADNNKK